MNGITQVEKFEDEHPLAVNIDRLNIHFTDN
jgi:hypothetical protein